MAVTQRPLASAAGAGQATAAAWKTIPSWYLLGRQDRAITPTSQRFMATRARSKLVEINSSHASMVSHPREVADLIERAAGQRSDHDDDDLKEEPRWQPTARTGDRIPLMLIHGAWLSSRSWETFADYFGKRGFAVSAPEWPRKHGDVEELRQDAEELKGLGIEEIVDHYDALIRALDQPPVLIGHSFGGLIVELLLDRGLGRAGSRSARHRPRDPRAPVLLAEGRRARSRSSVEVARGRDLNAGRVRVRVREHVLLPRTQPRRTSATPCPRRARSSSRPASPTSTSTHRPRCTSGTRIARRC